MTQTETESVLEANEAFYRAFRAGDIGAMNAVWARGRRVSCTHPDGLALFGREPVLESWRIIFARRKSLPIHAVEPQAILTGRTAMILCREQLGAFSFMASNVFVREPGGWCMVNHQAARIEAE